jgi:hypothetical protein
MRWVHIRKYLVAFLFTASWAGLFYASAGIAPKVVSMSAPQSLDAGDTEYLDRVITEQLRAFPLFGVAHRIASEDIKLTDKTTIAQGK